MKEGSAHKISYRTFVRGYNNRIKDDIQRRDLLQIGTLGLQDSRELS